MLLQKITMSNMRDIRIIYKERSFSKSISHSTYELTHEGLIQLVLKHPCKSNYTGRNSHTAEHDVICTFFDQLHKHSYYQGQTQDIKQSHRDKKNIQHISQQQHAKQNSRDQMKLSFNITTEQHHQLNSCRRTDYQQEHFNRGYVHIENKMMSIIYYNQYTHPNH